MGLFRHYFMESDGRQAIIGTCGNTCHTVCQHCRAAGGNNSVADIVPALGAYVLQQNNKKEMAHAQRLIDFMSQ